MRLKFPKFPSRPAVLLFAVAIVFQPRGAESAIDWNRARELHQKEVRGEALTPEERAYLERAHRLYRQGQRPPQAIRMTGPMQPAFEAVPLTELGTNFYKGQVGGLYGHGQNSPPPRLEARIRLATDQVKPLNGEGKPSAEGKVVLLSIGMSNTTQEFSEFKKLADADPAKSPRLVIVDGAQGGQSADRTAKESAPFWTVVEQRLRRAGVTPEQVEAAWLKQAFPRPSQPFPTEADRLYGYLIQNVQVMKKKFPNLRIVYLSSRIYAGYARTRLNPEPHAYESALAVRRLILDQLAGKPELNDNPARGQVKAPLLTWGPYLWANGPHPRRGDGLKWAPEDLGPDGTHPSRSGRRKVAGQLLRFFKTDPDARKWFVGFRFAIWQP